MKNYIFSTVFVLLLMTGTMLRAQDRREESLGLPGDNLNLYAVMKLFQESETLEKFERDLNDENQRINNLDLDNDGQVDYIRVIDNVDGNVHNIVLQVSINPRENQDVAVFTVWRESNDHVMVQLTGDEDLYGPNYIIEPIIDETPNPGYAGNYTVNRISTFEISAWPLVRFIYRPNYIIWHSPWYYSYYPSYWHPWHPFYWDYYYGYHYNDYSYYYGHYRHWNEHRYPRWHDSYYSRRTYSPDVHVRIERGNYKNTYSHPEQRREGTAAYQNTHSRQRDRSTNYNSGERSTSRRSVSGGSDRRTNTTGTSTRSTETRKSTSTGTSTRSTSGTGRRSVSTEADRRPVSTDNNRGQVSTGNDRKSTSTGTSTRSTSAGNERRSGGDRAVSSPRAERKAARSESRQRASRSSNDNKQSGTTSKSEGRRGRSRTAN